MYYPGVPITLVIFSVTVSLVVGYSWQDATLPTLAQQGVGIEVVWVVLTYLWRFCTNTSFRYALSWLQSESPLHCEFTFTFKSLQILNYFIIQYILFSPSNDYSSTKPAYDVRYHRSAAWPGLLRCGVKFDLARRRHGYCNHQGPYCHPLETHAC